MSSTLAAARALFEAGISTVAVATDGSKRPRGEWKEYQSRRANQQELIQWFGNGHSPGIGVVTGTVSGNLEMAEIEGRAFEHLQALEDAARASGLGPLWDKLETGWLERSPSGGIHWFYRLPYAPARNTKLASRPATPEELAENPLEKRKVLAETRGEGGFVVTAPSNGTTHESGKPWELIAGGPATVPTLTAEEHEAFHALLMTLNVEPPEPEPAPRQGPTAATSGMWGAVSPGDDFEAKTDWADILVPAGWRLTHTIGRTRYWMRPGKQHGRSSATTGNSPDRDRLFVFSTSTEFEAETPYTKFGAYALLNHGNDHSAAASELRRTGYGKDPEFTIGAAPSSASSTSPFAIPAGAPASAEAPPHTTGPARIAGQEQDPNQWATTGTLATVTDIATKQHPAPAAASTPAYTDDFNAHLFIRDHQDAVRFNADTGRWLWWTGQRWEEQRRDGGMARELAKETMRALDVDDNKTAATWKKKSLSAAGITSLLVSAATDMRIRVSANQLDARGWELNTPAGTIDLRTGELHPADPAALHTKMTAAAPDFEARSDLWEKFTADTFPDQELRDYVHRLVGYSAIGIVREHILPFGLGEGGNGKGVMFETLKAVLGDYAQTAPADFLMQTRYQNHPTDVAELQGARMVLNSEVNEGDKFDEAKVKRLAGGDSITARKMRQDNFTFRPTHQMWLFGNYTPGVEAGGNSFWRRLRLIPFSHTVPDAEKILDLAEQLITQHAGAVLAWVARGAAEYARAGLREPASVIAATADYQRSQDTVERFLEDECVRGPEATVTCNALRNAYNRYCESNGDKAIKGKALTAALGKHGVEPLGKINGVRYYQGARLAATDQTYGDYTQQPAPGF